MSTGRRLAKRSIIGTRVSAPGPDGIWYSGVIEEVKTPSYNLSPTDCINLTSDTRYKVRFDFKTSTDFDDAPTTNTTPIADIMISPSQSVRRNAMKKEFSESELIGPGFCTLDGKQLLPGQRVFITHNGRETSGDVITHDREKDEVIVKISCGNEEPLELKKRLEETRLLESRRSARLSNLDRDTDFARLADMGGERRKASEKIDVPYYTNSNSRKRRTSFSEEYDEMNECKAALLLMSLSHSPKSGWQTMLGSSPGSSSASWSSGTSSPPLSDDGQSATQLLIDNSHRNRTTSLSTSDEGIVMDDDTSPRKRRASRFKCTWKTCNVTKATKDDIERHIRQSHIGPKKSRQSPEEEFYYTEIEDCDEDDDETLANSKAPSPPSPTLSHRDMARPPHEDPEYQRQNGFYRQQCVIKSPSQSNISQNNNFQKNPTSPLAHHNYNTAYNNPKTSYNHHSSPVSPTKHARYSPRPSTSAPYPSPSSYVHHSNNNSTQYLTGYNTQNVTITPSSSMSSFNNRMPTTIHSSNCSPTNSNKSPQSPNRRPRGESKKCRKVYGMDRKGEWCTQCKWKKACSRFSD
ncbi:ZNF395 family protein [Megaselia abdita]